MDTQSQGMTHKIASFIVHTDKTQIPQDAYDHAKVAFMDWLAVTIGGKNDPLVKKLIAYEDIMGGHSQASILGYHMKKSVAQAALINGAASHALDYDDTLVSFLGHPSVTIFPSILALCEWKEKNGIDLLTAYLIGLQAGGTIGACASLDHYMAGWHATSTIGHLASAAACAKLLNLNEKQTRHALGIAGTQSSGLKRVFGSMCKPFHAGNAAQAGLMAAMLAKDDFTSAENIIEGPQGFFDVLKGKVNEDILGLLGLGWDVVNLSQKYHASCHATHSPLEACLSLINEHNIAIHTIQSIKVHSSQMAIDAAGNNNPQTGMEGKFSISYCISNAILRGTTGTIAFTDEKVNDPTIKALMKKIDVVLDSKRVALESQVEIITTNGDKFEAFSDILQQIPPLDIKKDRVKKKFQDLLKPTLSQQKIEQMQECIENLENIENIKPFIQGLNHHDE